MRLRRYGPRWTGGCRTMSSCKSNSGVAARKTTPDNRFDRLRRPLNRTFHLPKADTFRDTSRSDQRFALPLQRSRLEARSIERIVRSTYPVPAMTVRRKRDLVHAALRPAVVLVEHIDQQTAVIGSGVHRKGLPSTREVVQGEHRHATEVVPDR